MRLKLRFMVLAVILLTAISARAAVIVSPSQPGWFITGELLCDSYLMGVVDSIVSNRGIFEGNPICLPVVGATKDGYRAIVVNYLQAHENFRKAIGASLVVTALTQAYPCKPKS